VIPQPRNRAGLERRKNDLTHLCTDEHAQFVVLADHLRAHTRETFDGIAGDVLSQSTYLRPEMHERFIRGDIHGLAEFVLDGYGTTMSERALKRVLAPAVYGELSRERAIARLSADMTGHADAANPTASFFFANRTRREIALAPYALMRDVTAYAPYLDRDVYDFLAALPASLLMDRTLHTEAISRAWPQYVHIPYEQKGIAIEDRGAARALAAELVGAVMQRRMGDWTRRAAQVPSLAATCLDGNAARLWQASLLLYLDQIVKVASGTAPPPRAR
jgi:asparagine synthase (glutamine-hydrolysing)